MDKVERERRANGLLAVVDEWLRDKPEYGTRENVLLDMAVVLGMERDAAREQVRVLREGLDFYADEENYDDGVPIRTETVYIDHPEGEEWHMADWGRTARAALAATEPKEETSSGR